ELASLWRARRRAAQNLHRCSQRRAPHQARELPPHDAQGRAQRGVPQAFRAGRAGDRRGCAIMRIGGQELYRTLRVPIGSGPDEGKMFAVALSPDGRVAAVGGWDVFPEQRGDHAIYVFDTATGNLVRRLAGLGSVVRNMAFSPDGAFLAVTISDRQGL